MKFSEVVAQTIAWLQREERVSYRALKREFELDDGFLEDVKAELIEIKQLAVDQDGKMLVWIGTDSEGEKGKRGSGEKENPAKVVNAPPLTQDSALRTQHLSAERRQLTVMFCDLMGSTALSAQLDPEDYRAVVQHYHQTCDAVIQRHDGLVAQHLGDGLLIYFGYPTAHEDDARRAVRAGLEIITDLQQQVPSPLVGEGQGEGAKGKERKLQVRIGIHTGLVVVGDIGAPGRTEQLALGETPNVAARLQGLAEPNTVMISAATHRLIEEQFECQPFGSHLVKGLDTPIAVYHVQSQRQNASPLAGRTTLTPLVGREQEVGLLLDRWGQVKEGRGQVVLLSGEPGIGKSRLAYTVKAQVEHEGALFFEFRCSPYHVNSALYPLIEGIQHTLLMTRHEPATEQVAKLEHALALYDMQERLPLLTALLSLSSPATYPPLTLTPQKQKERTLQALVQLVVAQAERQATVSVWKDLHWADPSSLEFLSLLIDQIPTSKLLLVLTFRPEFTPPWKPRSHLSQLVLNRLGQNQVEAMIEQVAAGQPLPAEVLAQIRNKTDGVPLFVEELTKSVVESVGATGRSPLHLTIPATLQETLLARLDRLSTARQIAQLGATLGREFSYELLQAVAPVSETDLQTALTKLVEAEILYQRGIGPQSRYVFKHALIQDTAYQSLLKSTRQQYHQQIAHVLEDRFPDLKANQPELLAHHYTEAGLSEQALPYWQQAGQQAMQHSAYLEAISHFTKGLEQNNRQPETPERRQHELTLQIALAIPLMATKGFTSPELNTACTRALALCQQVGETPQLFGALRSVELVHWARAELQTAQEVAERLLHLAQQAQDSVLLMEAHYWLGFVMYTLGEVVTARAHLERSFALYDPGLSHSLVARSGADPGVTGLPLLATLLWILGYPAQALTQSRAALTLVQEIVDPVTKCVVWSWDIRLHQLLHETQTVQQQAETMITRYNELGMAHQAALWAFGPQGWALAMQGQVEEGISQIRQGLAVYQATGTEVFRPYCLALLAEAYSKAGQVEEGLSVVAEALAQVEKTGERFYEAELYRLKGELILNDERGMQNDERQTQEEKQETVPIQHSSFSIHRSEEAEACFLKAIDIARQQQAKSWELRAATSLARLWQSQGKAAEARQVLAEIYGWFTEGFDTKDLQEAKTLLEELAQA